MKFNKSSIIVAVIIQIFMCGCNTNKKDKINILNEKQVTNLIPVSELSCVIDSLYFEKKDSNFYKDQASYTFDNKIYIPNKEWVYKYFYIKQKDTSQF